MTGRDAEGSGPQGEETAAAERDAADAIRAAPPASLAAVDPGEPAELTDDEPPASADSPATQPGVPAPRPEMRTAPATQLSPPVPRPEEPSRPGDAAPAGPDDPDADDGQDTDAEPPGAAVMASDDKPGATAEPVPPADHGATVISPVAASGGQSGPAAVQPPAADRAAAVANDDKSGTAADQPPAAGRAATVTSPVVASGDRPGPAAGRAATVGRGDKARPTAGPSSAQDAGGPSVHHQPPVTEIVAAGVAAAAPRMTVPGRPAGVNEPGGAPDASPADRGGLPGSGAQPTAAHTPDPPAAAAPPASPARPASPAPSLSPALSAPVASPAPADTPPWVRAEEKQPSWPAVLRTTIRLWIERRRRPGQAGRPKRSRWRLAAVIGLVIVVFAAGVLTMWMVGRNSPAASGHPAHPPTGGAVAAARSEAAAWVTTEVSHGAIVACDPVMCSVLKQHGFPAGSMLTLSSAANDPLGSAVVIADAAVRNYFGPRLTGEYAPVAIASFGSGTARIQVLVIAADGAQAYDKALQADQRARRLTGQQLLGNPRITTSPAARADIASGQVDSRLLTSLAPLAAQVHQVRIASFSAAAPGAAPGVPLRSMDLAVPDGTDASAYLAAAQSFLRAQRAPYLASTIEVTRLGDGSQVLRVGFSAPSPLGILGTSDSAKQPS